MSSIKELRVRYRSVGSIKQITRAMEMVATTKLRRFQDRATTSRPYVEEIAGLVGRLAAVLSEEELAARPLLAPGKGKETLLLAVSSDRGLCGAYNSNLFRLAGSWYRERGQKDVVVVAYGRKAIHQLEKRGYPIEKALTDPPLEKIDFRSAQLLSRVLIREFLSGRYKDVVMLYTAFESTLRHVPTLITLLPITAPAPKEGEAAGDVILEPDAGTIFDHLLPRYLDTRVYNALLESLASEYASRRIAMKNATDSATDIQRALRKLYNRKRQENITKELLDIVGGAEALR